MTTEELTQRESGKKIGRIWKKKKRRKVREDENGWGKR